jgi:hypothetical protein
MTATAKGYRLPPMRLLELDAEEHRVFERVRASKFDPKSSSPAEREELEKLLSYTSPKLLDYLGELMRPGSAPHMRFTSWAEARATTPPPGFEWDQDHDLQPPAVALNLGELICVRDVLLSVRPAEGQGDAPLEFFTAIEKIEAALPQELV